jgi:hypothetical protein
MSSAVRIRNIRREIPRREIPSTSLPSDGCTPCATSKCENPQLRYVSVTMVQSARARLAGKVLCSSSSHVLGRLDGIIVDPAARRVLYFVVQAGCARDERYLLPFGFTPIRIETMTGNLHVDLEGDFLKECERFQTSSFPQFSDADLLTSLFPPPVAN